MGRDLSLALVISAGVFGETFGCFGGGLTLVFVGWGNRCLRVFSKNSPLVAWA